MLAGASRTRPDSAFDAEDIYCLFYTSGTTGRPKGVMLSHRAILQVAYNLKLETGPFSPGEKILLMQPMSHGAGFFVLPYWFAGGTCVIMPDFDASRGDPARGAHGIETIKLVPTMLQRILRLPGHRASAAAETAADDLRREPDADRGAARTRFRVFGDEKLVQIYGQSEAPVTMTVLHADQHRADTLHPERLASAGRPWTTVEIRVGGRTQARRADRRAGRSADARARR